MSVFMVQKNCDVNNLKEICSQIQISRCLKLINEDNDNKEKEFPTPKISVYISDIFIKLDENEEDEEEEEEENKDIEFMKNKYNKNG